MKYEPTDKLQVNMVVKLAEFDKLVLNLERDILSIYSFALYLQE